MATALVSVAKESENQRSPDDATAALVVAAQAGSVDAFEELVRDVGPPVYRFLFVRLGSDADARDALQETLIGAWQGIASMRDPRAFRAWLLTIARRKASDIEARNRPTPDLQSEAVTSSTGTEELELVAALRALSDEQREVVLLRYLLGLSEAETAVVTEVSVGTVKSRASRARTRLERLLALERSDGGQGQ
jgi:RNA polymerase sigma factor (sigma-70 family)